ncbi:IS1 family transposase [Chryseobacterium glaciei]|uniref:IS1 family transposase n=1 Tax=Chryseobacterium glaciei TaxID=1685010 RepID=UPI000B002B1E|nr:IS1 family transposase [Chryseobacterium glaciei]
MLLQKYYKKWNYKNKKKQQFFCKNCKKRFIDYYTYQAYRKNINSQIVSLTKEGLGIKSTSRILKISPTTLLKRIVTIANAISRPPIIYHQEYELDEMRFFIRKKSNPKWLVYAIDKNTKQVANFYIGRRNNSTLSSIVKTLINAKATKIYTDKLINYKYLIPKEIHLTKKYGTNGIERKNLSIRTNLKRFSRRTICFSKSMVILISILKIYFWD